MESLASQQPNPIFEILEKSQHFPKTNQTQRNAPQKTSHQPCLKIKPKNHQENLPSTMSTNQTQEPPRKPPIDQPTSIIFLKTQHHGISSFSTTQPPSHRLFPEIQDITLISHPIHNPSLNLLLCMCYNNVCKGNKSKNVYHSVKHQE
jgi:hypothetical protein